MAKQDVDRANPRQGCRYGSPFKRPNSRRQPGSVARTPPDWLRDSGGPAPFALMPGLGAGPFLLPHPVGDLAGIAQDGVVLSLRAATRASPLGDLLLLPPVLAGGLHLRQNSPNPPFSSSVKCQARRKNDRLAALAVPNRRLLPGRRRLKAAAIPGDRFVRGMNCPSPGPAREVLQNAPPLA